MKTIDRKEAKDLLLAFGAIAIIPASILFTRPRPLAADSLKALEKTARAQRTGEIIQKMERLSTTSLSFEKPDVKPCLNSFWMETEAALREQGAHDAAVIAQSARSNLQDYYPVVVEKGYLRNTPAWIIIGSARHDTGFIAWLCQPSANDIRQEKQARYCTNLRATAISVKPPYNVLR
jgi:hypothetical protein